MAPLQHDAILVLNAGSSSVKFSVFLDRAPLELLFRGQIDGLPARPHFQASAPDGGVLGDQVWPAGTVVEHAAAIEFLLDWGRTGVLQNHRLLAVGHRVVHGGVHFARPARIDAAVSAALERLIPLAPLHQPHNVAAIRTVASLAPNLPQVACFDTAFHRTQAPVAQAYGLPREYMERGLRRYGFHGLSYEYIASVLPDYSPAAAAGRTVVAHLGNGASLCALSAGRSVATTMGFSALDGLVMGTRCGAIDPGVLLYLLDQQQLDARALEHLLYADSGLLGVSGISSDMRTLLASDDPRAAEAIDLFVYRIQRELGSLVAALGGLDALVLTGGIGENSGAIRERICRDAAWLGLQFDADANAQGAARISGDGSRVAAWVIPTDEELVIARHTRALVQPGSN